MLRHTMAERPHHEMVQKPTFRDNFFSLKTTAQTRPDSVHTEFMETDWEEDDILSELEEDNGSSPRLSLDSVSDRLRYCHFEGAYTDQVYACSLVGQV